MYMYTFLLGRKTTCDANIYTSQKKLRNFWFFLLLTVYHRKSTKNCTYNNANIKFPIQLLFRSVCATEKLYATSWLRKHMYNSICMNNYITGISCCLIYWEGTFQKSLFWYTLVIRSNLVRGFTNYINWADIQK